MTEGCRVERTECGCDGKGVWVEGGVESGIWLSRGEGVILDPSIPNKETGPSGGRHLTFTKSSYILLVEPKI